MRSVIIRDFEISLYEIIGIFLIVVAVVVGSVWALQPKPPTLLSCGIGPSPNNLAPTQPDDSRPSLASAPLDQATRDLFENNRGLKKRNNKVDNNKIKEIVKERKNIMLNEMRSNPEGAIQQVLSDSESNKAQSLTKNCVEAPTTVQGSLEIVHVDFTNHASADNYVLTTQKKERINLHPANKSEKPLKSGEQVKIKGYRLDNDVLFDSSNQDNVTIISKSKKPWSDSKVEAATSDTSGPQQTIVLMVYFQNTSKPVLTKATVDNSIFASMNNYYQETSYNQMSVTGTSVDWVQIPMSQTCDIYTGLDNVQQAAIAAADPSVNFANYSRIIIVGNYGGYSCGWGGVGTVGKTYVNTADGLVRTSVSWVDQGSLGVTTHEFGHNLGLDHAQFADCGSATFNTAGCALDEYGDPYSPMGSGATAHMNVPEKESLGWLGTTHTQTITTNGNYTVEPLETSPVGLKAIKLKRGNGGAFGYDYTYYEYRTATGSDSILNSNVLSGALLHNFTDSYTMLLDATPPGDKNTPALPVGGSFTDPATATKVTLSSKTATALTFKVALGKTDFTTPTVDFTSPAYDATVSGTITPSATASAVSGIQKVEFYIDSSIAPTSTATTAPYSFVVDTNTLTNGYHYLYALAYDKSGEAYNVPGNVSDYAFQRIVVNNSTNPVYRLSRNGSYLFSTSFAERDAAVASYGYTYEGIPFYASTLPSPGQVSVYRLSRAGKYLFTTSLTERDAAVASYGYTYEGIPFYTSPTTSTDFAPLYRLSRSGNYLFTTSPQELANAVRKYGYGYEGVAFYATTMPAITPGSTFRLTRNGNYLLTTSAVELSNAVGKYGYTYEGTSFYTSPTPSPSLANVYRLSRAGKYLFTTSLTERDAAVASYGYTYEGTAFYASVAPSIGLDPVYRLSRSGSYLFTTSLTERDAAVASYGYSYEGTAFYASTGN